MGIFVQANQGIALGGVNTFNLYHFQFHNPVFFYFNNSFGIKNTPAGASSLAVMLLHVSYFGAFTDKKLMHPVVLRFFTAGIMNPAAGHNEHIGIFADFKSIVN